MELKQKDVERVAPGIIKVLRGYLDDCDYGNCACVVGDNFSCVGQKQPNDDDDGYNVTLYITPEEPEKLDFEWYKGVEEDLIVDYYQLDQLEEDEIMDGFHIMVEGRDFHTILYSDTENIYYNTYKTNIPKVNDYIESYFMA